MNKVNKKSGTSNFIVKPKERYYEGYCFGCGEHNQGTAVDFVQISAVDNVSIY